MYPPPEILEEVGRVTVAGSRLDVQMGFLWWHLDPSGVDQTDARKASAAAQADAVRKLAMRHLEGELRKKVLGAVGDADKARARRNEVVHQDWVLRGSDVFPSAEEVAGLQTDEQWQAFHERWERVAKPSPGWLRLPSRSLEVSQAQTLDELIAVERALGGITARIMFLTFEVASSRETGKPPGYVHGSDTGGEG